MKERTYLLPVVLFFSNAFGFTYAQNYSALILEPLDEHTYSGAYAINANGQAAGRSENLAVIWTNGVPRNIHALPANSSVAFALNDAGQAAGDVSSAGTNSGAFFWTGTSMQRILPPPGYFVQEAYAMNNSGMVVGTGGPTGGYRWQAGNFQHLEPLGGDWSARPVAINNFGLITGTSRGRDGRRPVIWTSGSPQLVPLPAGGVGGHAWGLNDGGVIVGEFYLGGSNDSRPFYWSPGTGTHALPLPDDATDGFAWAINNAGVIVGEADGQAVIWRKNAQAAYEVAVMERLLLNGTEWSDLFLSAINEEGQIAGDGFFQGNQRGFVLTPGPALRLDIRTDADRSGNTDFDLPSDVTTPSQPFYFWTNDDRDNSGAELNDGPADSADLLISTARQTRDLEDFARLALKLTPELRSALEGGATLALEMRGAGTIRLFSTPSSGAETRYLTDETYARTLVTTDATNVALPSGTSGNGITIWSHLEQRLTPADWDNGHLRFLWEGVTPGACELTLRLTQGDGTTLAADPVHLSLRRVSDFFRRVRATPANGFPPPWETNGQTPDMSWEVVYPQLVTPADQLNVDLVWVHGWRLREWERQNWAEIMFKRLWHAGYKGRFHAFTWPTHSGDDSKLNGYLTFDQSEHRAWKSGAALDNYLRALRSAHQDGRLVVVAHSMGNIVTGEALRRGAPADLQIMMQAAVSAGCYDVRSVLNDPELLKAEAKNPTPDLAADLGYRGFLGQIAVPTINYYNAEDFALQTGKFGINVNWFAHQGDKPYNPSGQGTYAYLNKTAGLYGGKKLLREVTLIHESLAFLARSRTRAVGAQPFTKFPQDSSSQNIDLQDLPLRFTRDADEHSAQFNRPIQRQLMEFYAAITSAVTPVAVP
ncbi:MAG: alpha/beta hydrolase [Candidatus Didemnitutus sp.]|nr:alpha/beta hydrolase [Candidatus Didemnitutus sp.]